MYNFIGLERIGETNCYEPRLLEFKKPITLQDMYDFIGCDTIEMPTRVIKGEKWTFIIDGIGRMKDLPPSIFFQGSGEDLVGNIIFCKIDWNDGETLSLTEEDIDFINKNFNEHAYQTDIDVGKIWVTRTSK